MMKTPALLLALAGAASVTLLAGCGAESPETKFSGPWAAEFANFYEKADSDFSRSILEDSKISELEVAEVWERFRSCLSASNITLGEIKSDGSYETSFPKNLNSDSANEASNICSRESGEAFVTPLYYWMQRNPTNEDEAKIVVSCLLEAGVVPPTYTVDQYRSDLPAGNIPLVDKDKGQKSLESCTSDPLGIGN